MVSVRLALFLLATMSAWSADAFAQSPPGEDGPASAPADRADGFVLRSNNDAFRLALRGLVQVDSRAFVGDQDQPGAEAVELRRLRPNIEATVFRAFTVRLVPDFGLGRAALFDAELVVHLTDSIDLRAGKHRVPFGLERLMSASTLLFIDRALPSELVPNRDVGLQLSGRLSRQRLAYGVGVYNGVVDGASSDTATHDGTDVVARVFVRPFRDSEHAHLRGAGAGLAVSTGTRSGSTTEPALPTLRTVGQQAFARYRRAGADTPHADGRHTRWSPHGYYYNGPLGVWSEWVVSSHDVRAGQAVSHAHVIS